MLIAGVVLAVALCGAMIFASYLTALYVEALRIRPHPNVRALEYSEDHVLPALRQDESEGLRRYTMVRQTAMMLFSVDVTLLTIQGGQATLVALGEIAFVCVAALALCGHIIPSILLTRTKGEWVAPLIFPARVLAWSIHPLVLLTGFANTVVELGGEEPEKKSGPAGHEIEALLDAGQEEGLIGAEDRRLIQSVVAFGDKTVREVMTPRPQIAAIEADSSVEDLRKMLLAEEYSRIPVYEGSIDHVVGFVHSRDMLEVEEDRRVSIPVRELARPLALVPETKPIHDLLRELQQKNAQMAIVVDEYGQTAGLATMEDLMEEIVGEIRDESEPDRDVVEYSDRSFVSSGNLDLDRLEELVGFRPDQETESTTVGGLVCEQLGQVPDPGARVRLDGIEIEVLSADERRVRTVRVRRVGDSAASPATAVEDSTS